MADTKQERSSKNSKADHSMSIWKIFRYANCADVLMMLLGTLGSIADGSLGGAGVLIILSGLINSLGSDVPIPEHSDFVNTMNKQIVPFLYLAAGIWIAAFLEGFCWTRTAERQASVLRRKYLRAVLRQEEGFFDTSGTHISEVVNSVYNDTLVIQDTLSEKVPNFVMNLSNFVASYAASLYLSWRLAMVTLPLSSLLVLGGLLYGRTLIRIAKKMQAECNKSSMVAEQAISSIRTVYSFVGEAKAMANFSLALDATVKIGLKQGLSKGMAIGGNGSVSFALWAFISWYGSRLVMNHDVSGGMVFGVGYCIILGGLSLASALPNLKYFSEAGVAAIRIFKMIDRVPEIDSEDGKGKVLEKVSGEVEFRNVQFAYPSRPDSMIFHNFCLTIPARHTVALVGGSGSGKSTAISLLERFYDPLKGEILVDGENIKGLQLKWLRNQIGLVSQEPALFASTICENILFGKEDATMDEIISVAKASNAHDFITQLPEGYGTQVGAGGTQMSGGQKQRIAIARAMLKNPSILLLDEATSALDAESEKIVQDALGKASIGRTTVVVAHRLSTIQGAHKIAVMQKGEVIEFGGHQELISNPIGAYTALLQMQQKAPSHDTNAASNTLMPSGVNSQSLDDNKSPARSNQFDSCISGLEQEELKANAAPKSFFWRLLALNVPQWKNTLMGCVGAFGYAATQIAYSVTVATMISALFLKDGNDISSKVGTYCILFIALAVHVFAVNLVQHYNFAVVGEFLAKRIRQRMFSKILTFEVGWFDQDQNSSGAVCSKLAKEANVVRSLVGDRVSLLVECVSGVTITLTLGMLVAWRLAIVLIAVQPLMVLCFYTRNVLLKSVSGKSIKAQNQGSQAAFECVTHHRTIAAFCSQQKIINIFDSTQTGPRREINKQSWYAGLALGTSKFLEICYWPFEFWYGGKLIAQGVISFHAFLLNHFIFGRLGRMIADAGSMTSDLAKGSDAVTSVFEILDRNSLINPENRDGVNPEKVRGSVALNSVDFAYPARPNAMILRNFSLKVNAGSSVALVGKSGCGKSTIIGLIERFYDPLKGTVLVDGKDIRSFNLRSLREHIALVGQEPTLFAGSIRENIAYGKENASEAEIIDAAKAANAHEFISCLKDGYETSTGNRGTQLSGGQKQRIAIARAIIKNPSILLLDEATSALDAYSEKVVQEALDRVTVGRTTVTVAHRLASVQNADCIAVIEKGSVVEQGNHLHLMEKGEGGAYFGLIKLQQRQ
eukprot:PITA_23516